MKGWDQIRAALIVLHVVVLTVAAVPGVGGRIVRPIRPYLEATGLRQSWQMFGTVSDHGGILEIDGRTAGGGWAPLFADHTPHQWNALLLNHGRVRAQRSLFAHKRFRRRYREMAAWLGAEALADRPDLSAIRVRFRDVRTPPLGAFEGTRTEAGTFWEEIVERGP